MNDFITPSDSIGEPCIRNSIDSVRDEISKMCLSILDSFDSGEIKSLPINERTLRRGYKGESIDEKSIRTIACLYYKTEDFERLVELVPVALKNTIEATNSKLSHQGNVPFEVARNPDLAKLWNLCLGYGCTRELGESYFGGEFNSMINVLVEYKLVTKSVLKTELWLASGDMITSRDDLLFHYDQMAILTRPILNDPSLSKPIQFCGEMTRESFNRLQEKMLELFNEHVRKEALVESDKKEVKFNFQLSLCELSPVKEGAHEVQ